MGYSFDELFPRRFLKAADFRGKDYTLTVKTVTLEELEGKKGPEMKAVVGFRETPKQLVLNRTNAECMKAMFGDHTDKWLGKRVTFFPANVHYEDTDIAIRVRGSPDIKAPIAFDLKLPRKKPKPVTLQKTTKAGASPSPKAPVASAKPTAAAPAPSPSPAAEPAPEGELTYDPETGEIPDGPDPFADEPEEAAL